MDGFLDFSAIMGSGVYALIFGEEVVYIGKAKRMLARIYTHKHLMSRPNFGKVVKGQFRETKVVRFSKVYIRPCHENDMDRLEKELIAAYRPRYNTNLQPKDRRTLLEAGFDFNIMFNIPQKIPERMERRF